MSEGVDPVSEDDVLLKEEGAGEEKPLLNAKADALDRAKESGYDRVARVFGPGLVVCLADTDASCIVTAAQTGAQFGFSFIKVQLLLIPVLFMVQELTVRLAIYTGKGHGELIREVYGGGWAWFSVSTLVFVCVGTMISEMVGIAAVGSMFGIPPLVSMILTDIALGLTVSTGRYTIAERIALALGIFELAFFILMVEGLMSDRAGDFDFWAGSTQGSPDWWWLLAANVGAVIMPFMIFYQQSSVVDKGLTEEDIVLSRWDVGIGSVLTQAIMIAVIVAAAVYLQDDGPQNLRSIEEISKAFTKSMGETAGKVIFGLGVVGAAMVAAIVLGLAAAWGLGEVAGYPKSLNSSIPEAPQFYFVYATSILAGNVVALACSASDIVQLCITVNVLNAILLAPVLGFLYGLSRDALPEGQRLKGTEAIVYAAVFTTVVVICWGSTFWSLVSS